MKKVKEKRAESLLTILISSTIFTTVFMQPSPTCTGNPFRTRSFQDIVLIGSKAHAAYIRINAITSGFVKPVLLGRWSLT